MRTAEIDSSDAAPADEPDLVLTERKLASLRQLAEETTAALSRFSQAAIDRELRVIELKQEVDFLRGRCGESPRYLLEPEPLGVDAVHAREVAARLDLELREEIAERMVVEEALRESRARLARELEDTKILQRTGSLLIKDERSDGLHEDILEAAMAIMSADSSSIQVADAEGGELRLLAWKNFHPDSAQYWRKVSLRSGTSCVMALRQGQRILIPDVEAEAALQGTENLRHYRLSGIKAVQSTPLIARDGRLVGMMSTYWRERHEPDERALALFDVLARQMADVLERRRALSIMHSTELWLAGQNQAFQAVLDGATLEESLKVLVRAAVAHLMGEDGGCELHTADHAGQSLYYIVGRCDHDHETSADGSAAGPESLACGLAFYLQQPAAAPDVNENPLSEQWRWLTENADYRGSWFFPIESSSGKVVGTAAFFFGSPREAMPREIEFAAVLTRAAGIVIAHSQEADERARAERARRESEQKYRTLFDSIDEGLGIVEVVRDPAGRGVDASFVDVNVVFERLTGLAGLQGRRISESGFGIEAAWLQGLTQVALTGEPQRLERYHRDHRRWYRVHVSRVGGDGSDQVGIVLEDISERKHRERNQALLAEVSDELVRLDKVSDTMARLSERIARHFDASWCLFAELGDDLETPTAVYAWNAPDVAPLNGAQLLRDFLSEPRLAANQPGEASTVSDVGTDGRLSAPKYGALGIRSFVIVPLVREQVCRFVLAIVDSKARVWRGEEIELTRELTQRLCTRLERARAEAALRHSEERLRTLADSVPQLIWTNRGDGTADYFNHRWYEYTGLAFSESYGLGWEACVHPDDALRSKREWARTQAAGAVFDCEYRLRGADGHYRWFIGRNVPMKEADGAVTGWFGSATDIHDLKLAQAELQEADRRKNHFLAMLGHELRNPLAAIRNGVKLLRSEKARPESRAAALPIVADQVGHMERLVDDLLDLTRVVQGSVQVDRQPMAVQDALQQALELVRLQAEAGGFAIHESIPAEPLPILGDRVRLIQVFMNVLGNAVKYSDDAPLIEVSAAREGGNAVVRIRDHGRGISPELLPRIFDPFVQAAPGLTLQAGLGLGLAVVRQLMRLHDGEVEIFSQGEKQGSEVVLRLPLSSPASWNPPASATD